MDRVMIVNDGTIPYGSSGILFERNVEFAVDQTAPDKFISQSDTDYDVLVLTADSLHYLRDRMGKRFVDLCRRSELLVISSDEDVNFDSEVRSYKPKTLIAPKGKEEVSEAIDDLIQSTKAKRAKENFEKMVLQEAERVKPIIREQFLRDYILGVGDTDEIFSIYCKTFGVQYTMKTRMIVFQPEQELDFDDAFFLKNIIEGYIGDSNIILSTSIKDNILIVTNITAETPLLMLLHKLEKVFTKYYNYGVTMVYSGSVSIADSPETYEHLRECLGYSFYAGTKSVICADELVLSRSETHIEPNYCNIERAVKSGDAERTRHLIDQLFADVEKAKLGPAVAKTYCLELYVCVIRCCEVEKIDKYMKGIMELQMLKTLEEIKVYVMRVAMEIVESNRPKKPKIYSSLIGETLEIIEKNLGNENLSLRWLAGNILYTNVDYLGKLFKKEIGENFSHYVMKKRMEMAKDLIVNGKKDRIYEVAEKVGYGSNSQYFSQVFKKYTGVSPLEYKEFSRFSTGEPA